MQKFLLELGRCDRTEKKRCDLSFFLIQLVTRITTYITFPIVLFEMESGEIEWFEYKFVLKKRPFICWALVFNRLTTGSDETKCEKFNRAVSHMVLIHNNT